MVSGVPVKRLRSRASGKPCWPGSKGFTLLEILAVVFIVAMMLTVAVQSLTPNQNKLLEQESERILALMKLVQEEAILNAQEMAFVVNEKGYGFQTFSAEGWQALEDDNLLRDRTLPEQIRMDMNIMGEEMALSLSETVVSLESDDDEEKKDNVRARVLFLSSGEMTPFELFLHFESDEDGYTIEGNEMGALSLKTLKVTL